MVYITNGDRQINNSFLFIDVATTKTDVLVDALNKIDPYANYYNLSLEKLDEAAFLNPNLIIFYVESSEVENSLNNIAQCMGKMPSVPTAVITDIKDIQFYQNFYRKGVRGVLHTSLTARRAQQILHLMANGGTYYPASMLVDKI